MRESSAALTVRLATVEDFDDIRRLNHQTFAAEIPQHAPRPDGRLVDRFEDESTFIIARDHEKLAGMLALRDQRPFSIDAKLPDVDSHLPPGRKLCEIRLLAVEPGRQLAFRVDQPHPPRGRRPAIGPGCRQSGRRYPKT